MRLIFAVLLSLSISQTVLALDVQQVLLSECYVLPEFDQNLISKTIDSNDRIELRARYGYIKINNILVIAYDSRLRSIYEKEIQTKTNMVHEFISYSNNRNNPELHARNKLNASINVFLAEKMSFVCR